MKPIRAALLLSLTIAAFRCSSAPSNPAPTVPVAGSASDVAALAGRWEGEYASEATGRSGSIVFELKPGDRVARGDVYMKPRPAPAGSSELPGTTPAIPQILTISFVSASGGVLTGTMDPYTDPSCDCEVRTTFVGRLSGDRIAGTFTTTPTGAAPITTGEWSMRRRRQ